MRVLSLLQPWASLWVAGPPHGKGIETRSWPTDYRGWVAVASSARFAPGDRVLCDRDPFWIALRDLGFSDPVDLPMGKIIGVVRLVDCRTMMSVGALGNGRGPFALGVGGEGADPRLTERERAFGNYADGRYAWITGDRRVRLPEPIPFKGGLGLRKLPGDLAERLGALVAD